MELAGGFRFGGVEVGWGLWKEKAGSVVVCVVFFLGKVLVESWGCSREDQE